MTKSGYYTIVRFIALLLLILIGGPRLSRYFLERSKDTIRKNGIETRAVITGKNSHKGNSVTFSYTFKNKHYRNREHGDDHYNNYLIGDSLTIALDSTNPSESYIVQ